MSRFKNLAGERYGKLKIVELSEIRSEAYWICECDCGKKVKVRGSHLRNMRKMDCGCTTKRQSFVAQTFKYGRGT